MRSLEPWDKPTLWSQAPAARKWLRSCSQSQLHVQEEASPDRKTEDTTRPSSESSSAGTIGHQRSIKRRSDHRKQLHYAAAGSKTNPGPKHSMH